MWQLEVFSYLDFNRMNISCYSRVFIRFWLFYYMEPCYIYTVTISHTTSHRQRDALQEIVKKNNDLCITTHMLTVLL